MFCAKCGKNVGEGMFCPSCGNRIIPETSGETAEMPVTPVEIPVTPAEMPVTPVETPVTPAEMPVTPAETPVTPAEIPVTPEDIPATPVEMPVTPVEDAFSFGIEKPKKKNKNKKWLKITGIVAAVLIVLGVAGYLAYPMLLPIISPKAYAVAALKNTTSKLADNVDDAITNIDFSSITTPKEGSMTLQLDKLDIKSGSILSDFSGKTVTMKIQTSPSDGVEVGTITLGTSGATALSIQFYMDESTITFKIPELSSQTFSMSLSSLTDNSNFSYSQVSGIMSSLSGADIQKYVTQYSPLIKAVVQDVIKGLDTVIDNAKYTRTDSKTYESENGNMKVSVYDIVISEEAIKQGVIATINNLFSDKELSSYVSMLTMATGQTKQKLIQAVEIADLGISNIPLTVYFNSNKEIVKTILDLNKITGDDAQFSVEFIGKNNLYDYIIVNGQGDNAIAKMTVKNEANEFYYAMDIRSGETGNEDQFINAVFQGKFQNSGSDVNIIIDKLSATGSLDGEVFDIALTGKSSSKTISTGPNKSSSFTNAIDVEYMTTTQKKTILTEVSNNLPKLKGKLPDTLLNEMTTSVKNELATLK